MIVLYLFLKPWVLMIMMKNNYLQYKANINFNNIFDYIILKEAPDKKWSKFSIVKNRTFWHIISKN